MFAYWEATQGVKWLFYKMYPQWRSAFPFTCGNSILEDIPLYAKSFDVTSPLRHYQIKNGQSFGMFTFLLFTLVKFSDICKHMHVTLEIRKRFKSRFNLFAEWIFYLCKHQVRIASRRRSQWCNAPKRFHNLRGSDGLWMH